MDDKAHEAGREAMEREPTEGTTASPATVGTLKRLEDETYTAYGVDHRPAGLKWVSLTLDLAKRITDEPDLLNVITEADLDQLTEDNFHTARHAAEVARYLKEYTV